MRMTKVAAVMVLKVGGQRPRAQPLSAVQHAALTALGVPITSCPLPPSGGGQEGSRRPGKRQQAWARWPTARSIAGVKGPVIAINWHVPRALSLAKGHPKRKNREPREPPLA
jgi:hypothetical protein